VFFSRFYAAMRSLRIARLLLWRHATRNERLVAIKERVGNHDLCQQSALLPTAESPPLRI
jgi:hypothetical protein